MRGGQTVERNSRRHYYKKDEYAGLVLTLRAFGAEEVLEYLGKHPASSTATITNAMDWHASNTEFLMHDLKMAGLLKSELREVTPATAEKLGHAVPHYSLAEDYAERRKEILDAAEASRVAFVTRRSSTQNKPTAKLRAHPKVRPRSEGPDGIRGREIDGIPSGTL